MTARLRLIDAATGEVQGSTCPDCNDLIAKVAAVERDRDLAEADIRKMRVQVKALKRDRERERETYARRARVEKLFGLYKKILDKPACKLGPARFDALRRMVDLDYTDVHFELAFYGAKHAPFVKDGKKFQELELVCRNESKFEDFANRGALAVRELKVTLECADA